jgi:hypothetical protein
MNIVQKEFEALKHKYPKLKINFDADGNWIINGEVRIIAISKVSEFKLIEDYVIEIIIDKEYPKILPKVYEKKGKIPKNFEHVNSDNTLCLGLDIEVKLKLHNKMNLLNWFDTFVVTFFYNAEHFKRYGFVCVGERSHGIDGLLEGIGEILKTDRIETMIRLIKIKNNFRKNDLCVCGSKKKIRSCHMKELLKINDIETEEILKQLCSYYAKLKFKKNGTFPYLIYNNIEYKRKYQELVKYYNRLLNK